ncbi:MAG: hypothetical protein HOO96_30960 [Polyangiaceae bacterium]|nr:hypothetical protein [Polyangiaceae bacterium]
MQKTWMVAGSMMLLATGMGCKKGDGAADGGAGAASASASASATTATTAAAAASTGKPDPCANSKPPEFKYADVKFEWTETPALTSAPKDKAYAFVGGGKPFELPKIELWVSERNGDWSLRTNDGVIMGPSLSFKGVPKAGETINDKFGSNSGYFQVPQKGDTVRCHGESTSYNGKNARIVKITKYDGKTADGTFVTTWEETFGEKRKFWAAGTFKDAKVVVFKK